MLITPALINTPSGIEGINNMAALQTNQSNTTPTKPRAFINVLFFNEQFNAVDFKISMVGNNSVVKDHFTELQNLLATKSGYVYIYCSNESPVNVFFDNLQVEQTRGPILEETHYYPFGLTMSGISSKAAGSLENKRKWNKGSELESKEFSDGSGLELYSTFYRSLDPQLGKFWQVDPKPTEYESPFAAMGNNPISNVDPKGDYFFGLFGSTHAQRKAAREFAAETGGTVHNITSKNVSVSYSFQVGDDKMHVGVGSTNFYSDGFAKVLGKQAHKTFEYQSNGLKYGWGRINPNTGTFETILASGRVEMLMTQ